DWELLREIGRLFLADYPQQLAGVRQAALHGDGAALERLAHGLKGSVGNFHAPAAVAAALCLERMGREGRMDGVEPALDALGRELELTASALTEIMEKQGERT